ncbi:hypothetical protein GCM10028808_10010 [Spirosoma migulaei]
MKIWLIGALLLSYFAEAQQPIYKPFEVDSMAEPRGGQKSIDSYVRISLRKPVTALKLGLAGRVIVTGTVEPNGFVSGVSVLQGLQADCDTEAVRVFSTFNAWKPALKAGKPVRQQVTYPVVFKPNKPFIYENGAQINYYDKNKGLVDSTTWKTRYKLVKPVKPNWLPSGDMVLYKSKGATSWIEDTRYKLVREELTNKTPTGKRITRLSYRTPTNELFDKSYEIDEDGIMLSSISYDKKGEPFDLFSYAPNGALLEVTRNYRSTVKLSNTGLVNSWKPTLIKHVMSWYPTGQEYAIIVYEQPDQLPQIISMRDSTGLVLVDKGYGTAIFLAIKTSHLDTTRKTLFTETGPVEGAFKQGIWTGRYADGSYFYEEQYDKGICRAGKAWAVGRDTVRYTTLENPPEFQNGMAGLEQFLRKNLRYPFDTKLTKTQNKVFVRFMVGADGTLTEYEVTKPVHPELDQEAIRIVSLMSGLWKPGIRRGMEVRMNYTVPINFSLN